MSCNNLSTHDLTRRSTYNKLIGLTGIIFQLTTSQGGRLGIHGRYECYGNLSTHDLTRRSTHRGSANSPAEDPFNSRPHKEVDGYLKFNAPRAIFFQLTTSQGGRQHTSFVMSILICLSTHDLTRRSTQSSADPPDQKSSFNSRPHKEVDIRKTLRTEAGKFFQLTTSQGGRLQGCNGPVTEAIFQLTTSQGGRHLKIPGENNE